VADVSHKKCSSIFNRLASSRLESIFGSHHACSLVIAGTQGDLVFIMKEIWIVAEKLLILAAVIASIAFYGLVFWHWRNEGKGREGSQEIPGAAR
jgi:hypothetical protein